MTNIDYDDPQVEEQWFAERRAEVIAYLSKQGLKHGPIPAAPEWSVAPYVSIWTVGSIKAPGNIGWWAICGDLPTDYVSASGMAGPRDVMRQISARWSEVSAYMLRGEPHPGIKIGGPDSWPELGPLLEARASILEDWAEDDEMWSDED